MSLWMVKKEECDKVPHVIPWKVIGALKGTWAPRASFPRESWSLSLSGLKAKRLACTGG